MNRSKSKASINDYIKYVEKLKKRKTSGAYEQLPEQPRKIYNMIKEIVKNKNNNVFEEKDVRAKLGNFTRRLTDFCYNKVNLNDDKNKFLFWIDEKKYQFLDFNSQETINVTWTFKLSGVEHTVTVGLYQDRSFLWDFDELTTKLKPNNEEVRIPEEIVISKKFNELDEEIRLPEEIMVLEKYTEGSLKTIHVNAYERNKKARSACIALKGAKCIICNFEFHTLYGEYGRGYIQIHHVIPLSEIKQEYEVDPKEDLVPVCPNCHAMIHKSNPPLDVAVLKEMIQENRKKNL